MMRHRIANDIVPGKRALSWHVLEGEKEKEKKKRKKMNYFGISFTREVTSGTVRKRNKAIL